MTKCIKKIRHEECGGGGLQIFANEKGDGVNGYCFSCGKYVPNPLGEGTTIDDIELPKKKTEEEIEAELHEIASFTTVDLPERKLRAADLGEFGVKTALSEEDGKTPTLACYPYRNNGTITGYKVKTTGEHKKTWSIGTLKDVDMFGWDEAVKDGGFKLIITEGEEDAVAMKKIITRFTDKKFEHLKPSVVSLPFGAGTINGKHWARYVKQIRENGFKEVVLAFDNDKPGQEAVNEALKMLPEAKSVKLPSKDANACVVEGKQRKAFNMLTFSAERPKNTRIVSADSLFEEAAVPAEFGELTWPWETMNETTRGIRYGETIYIGAGAKMGKSEVVDTLISHFIENHGIQVFTAKPEQANKSTVKKIAGKIAGKIFDDPKVAFDRKAYDSACEVMRGKLHLVNLYQHLGWETLQADIREAAAMGCKAVFIDPITNLTNGMNAAEANTKLQEIAQTLAQMALDLNIVIFIFCHLKSPEGNISKEQRLKKYQHGNYIGLGNCPHEFGGDVLSAQFAGSRAMMRSCNYMIGLEGNKDPEIEDSEVRNQRHLKLLEDREFGESIIVPLFWNKHTTRFKEI